MGRGRRRDEFWVCVCSLFYDHHHIVLVPLNTTVCVCVCMHACACAFCACAQVCLRVFRYTYLASGGWPSYMTTKLKAPLNYILES